MFIVSWLCLALAGWFLWRWLRRSPDKNPMEQRFPGTTLAVLAAVGAAAYWPTFQADQAARRAGAAASGLLGETVAYTCGSQLGTFVDRDTDFAFGYVRWGPDGPEKRSKLRHETCDGLVAFLGELHLRGDARARQTKVIGVHVVSHEARHMAGEMSETRAECQALQRNAALALALGASEAVARELALAYWTDYFPRMGPGYRSPDCRQGGALDEDLPTSPWNLGR
jgi:hypothetical protein